MKIYLFIVLGLLLTGCSEVVQDENTYPDTNATNFFCFYNDVYKVEELKAYYADGSVKSSTVSSLVVIDKDTNAPKECVSDVIYSEIK